MIRSDKITDESKSDLLSDGRHKARLLLFGSSSYQLGLMKSLLETYGYESIVLTTITELVETREDQPDLIIMLIDRDTPWDAIEQQFKLLRELHKHLPLLFIASCDNSEVRKKLALTMVDDFLCLPVKKDELLLRLEACLSKHKARSSSDGSYPCVERRQGERRRINDDREALFQIDDRTKEVLVRGETIALTPKEFELLTLLSSDPGKVFSIKAIRDYLWPGESKATAADVQQYIHRLRSKVEMDPSRPCHIQTVKGFGYRLSNRETEE